MSAGVAQLVEQRICNAKALWVRVPPPAPAIITGWVGTIRILYKRTETTNLA